MVDSRVFYKAVGSNLLGINNAHVYFDVDYPCSGKDWERLPTILYSRDMHAQSAPLAHPDILVTAIDREAKEERIVAIIDISRYGFSPAFFLSSLFPSMISSYALRPTNDGNRCLYFSEDTDYYHLAISTDKALQGIRGNPYDSIIQETTGYGKYIKSVVTVTGTLEDFQADLGKEFRKFIQSHVNYIVFGPRTIDDEIEEILASNPGAEKTIVMFDQDGQVTDDPEKMVKSALSIDLGDRLLYEAWFEKAND